MCGYLNAHGTCPNLFGGEFISFELVLLALDEEVSEPAFGSVGMAHVNPATLERFAIDSVEGEPLADEGELYEPDYAAISAATEEHFSVMAEEAGLNPRDYNTYSAADQQLIINAWVTKYYGHQGDYARDHRAMMRKRDVDTASQWGAQRLHREEHILCNRKRGPCGHRSDRNRGRKPIVVWKHREPRGAYRIHFDHWLEQMLPGHDGRMSAGAFLDGFH